MNEEFKALTQAKINACQKTTAQKKREAESLTIDDFMLRVRNGETNPRFYYFQTHTEEPEVEHKCPTVLLKNVMRVFDEFKKQGVFKIVLDMTYTVWIKLGNNRLDHEITMYKYVSLLTFYRVTPHVVTYQMDYNCDTNEVDSTEAGTTVKEFLDIVKREKHKLLFTEHLKKTFSLHQILKNRFENNEYFPFPQTEVSKFWPHVLCQILFTLLCFQKIGLVHGDLHVGNILVTYLDTPQNLLYSLGPQKDSYSFSTNFFVRIMDFGMSGKSKKAAKLKENKEFEVFSSNFQAYPTRINESVRQAVEKNRPNYDVFVFISNLLIYNGLPKWLKQNEAVIKIDQTNTKTKHGYMFRPEKIEEKYADEIISSQFLSKLFKDNAKSRIINTHYYGVGEPAGFVKFTLPQ